MSTRTRKRSKGDRAYLTERATRERAWMAGAPDGVLVFTWTCDRCGSRLPSSEQRCPCELQS